jgi:UPF0755 protein
MFAALARRIRQGCLVLGVLLGLWLFIPLSPPTTPYSFELTSGRSLRGVARDLSDQGLLYFPSLFYGVGRFCPHASHLRAGSYAIEGAVSPWDLLNILFLGRSSQHDVTLVEGMTFAEIRRTLAEEPTLKHELLALSDRDVLAALKIDLPLPSEFLRPEGIFRPDTYFYSAGSSDLALLQRAYALQMKTLDAAWAKRAGDLPVKTPFEALILASIVERETADRSERPLIAGVFVHRLAIGMRLQTDPTVIYGLGDRYSGKLHHADMIHDTPWNTYTRGGLPPTPIGLPGREAIEAALHPTPTRALYFVARGNGTHQFSESLSAHEEAVNNFLRRSNKAR